MVSASAASTQSLNATRPVPLSWARATIVVSIVVLWKASRSSLSSAMQCFIISVGSGERYPIPEVNGRKDCSRDADNPLGFCSYVKARME